MTTYAFTDHNGVERLLDFPMGEAPSIGQQITVDGVVLTRQVGRLQWCAKPEPRHIGYQIHRWHPDAPHHTETGLAAFTCKREIDEFQAKTGIVYDR